VKEKEENLPARAVFGLSSAREDIDRKTKREIGGERQDPRNQEIQRKGSKSARKVRSPASGPTSKSHSISSGDSTVSLQREEKGVYG